MNISRIALTTVAIAATALTACSSETRSAASGAASTSVDPAAATVIAEATTLPAAPVTTAAAPAPAPQPTQAPAPAPAPTTAPATTAAPAPGLSLYDEVNRPITPNTHTDPFAASGTLGNGVYWVIYSGGETMTPSIEVVQAFFGADCETQAAANGEECLDDIYVLATPSREIDNLAFTDDVYLTVAASMSQRSYWITPDELRSVRASSPSDPAPADFSFTSFPFLMTVQGGQITKFEQVWEP